MRLHILFLMLALLCFPIAFAQDENNSSNEETPPPPRGSIMKALQLPEISVVGNIHTLFSSNKQDEDRNKVKLEEVELALQSWIYPTIRGDVILAFHEHLEPTGEKHTHAEVEEGYVSFLNLGGGFSLKAGRMRVGFGKENPIHPHHRLYVDNPSILTTLFSEHGLIGDGATLSYLLPAKTFTQLDLSTWQVVTPHTGEGMPGLEKTLNTARLWISTPYRDGELESGFSAARGAGSEPVKMLGFDLTFKRWPGAFGRDLLRTEIFQAEHNGQKTNGWYLLGAHKFTKYWEGAMRIDNSELVGGGREKALSLIASNYLTETSILRFEYQYCDGRDGADNRFWVQVIFGMGPHAHPLE
ncbi:MAG: hypothetical protein ACPLSK_02500 [bacterium]